jgi:hypothetical protein
LRERTRAGGGVYESETLLDGAQTRRLLADGAFELVETRDELAVGVGSVGRVALACAVVAVVRRLRVFVLRHRSSVGK